MMESEAEAREIHSARETLDEALGRIDPAEVAKSVAEFARESPHVALVAAAGLGFLIGGGLTPRLLGAIGLMATRNYFRETVTAALHDIINEQLRAQQG